MQIIDFFSFKNFPESIMLEWKLAINNVLDKGLFIGGPEVETFEKSWSEYLNVKHSIGVGNGYDAIFIALKVLGISSGDIVAVPNHTFVATWLSVKATGATPIGIDCDVNGLINLDKLEASDSNYAAVVPVHMHGQMVDMERLKRWADAKHIKIVEDCAQAHGAKIKNRMAGTWGDFGAFSFYPTKNLGAIGDAGALVTNDDDLARSARSVANYGRTQESKNDYERLGINSRLDPIQAAVLTVNLKYLDEWNKKRIELANRYNLITSSNNITTINNTYGSVFHHYIVRSKNRNKTRELLLNYGIRTEIHYSQSANQIFAQINGESVKTDISESSKLSSETLSLPLSPWMTLDEFDYVEGIILTPEVLESFF